VGILQLSGLTLHRGAALHSQPRTSTRPLMFVTHWWRLQRQSALPPIACRPSDHLQPYPHPPPAHGDHAAPPASPPACEPTSSALASSTTGNDSTFLGWLESVARVGRGTVWHCCIDLQVVPGVRGNRMRTNSAMLRGH
jgi:hypothetical protein